MVTREDVHELVDAMFDVAESGKGIKFTVLDEEELASMSTSPTGDTSPSVSPARVLPEGKRAVRTKTSGDRVYFIDEVKKTRAWVTNPDVLDSLGFEMGDVVDVEEDELLKYQMSSALYRRVDAE